jgi:hypothetical protein
MPQFLYRIEQGAFGRWYILHPNRPEGWTGTKWVPCYPLVDLLCGVPTGEAEIANFPTQSEAEEYAWQHALDIAKAA